MRVVDCTFDLQLLVCISRCEINRKMKEARGGASVDSYHLWSQERSKRRSTRISLDKSLLRSLWRSRTSLGFRRSRTLIFARRKSRESRRSAHKSTGSPTCSSWLILRARGRPFNVGCFFFILGTLRARGAIRGTCLWFLESQWRIYFYVSFVDFV